MQTEIEVKFLNIDHDALRDALKKAGGECEQPMRMMRRAVFDWPGRALENTDDGFLRVRDEGHQITMTYKVFNERTVDGAGEVEIIISDFEKGIVLLQSIGMILKSEQESKRETWRLGDCEVVLDVWPWLKPYIEIEGPSKEEVRRTAEILGFNWDDAVYGSVTSAYRAEYAIPEKISIGDNPRIAFDDPLPVWLSELRRTDGEI